MAIMILSEKILEQGTTTMEENSGLIISTMLGIPICLRVKILLVLFTILEGCSMGCSGC
jgi:hypothetical protein